MRHTSLPWSLFLLASGAACLPATPTLSSSPDGAGAVPVPAPPAATAPTYAAPIPASPSLPLDLPAPTISIDDGDLPVPSSPVPPPPPSSSPTPVADPTMQVPASEFVSSASQAVIDGLAVAASGGDVPLVSYRINGGTHSPDSTVYGDWRNFTDSSAYYFVADMDVDCDGVDYQCKNNPDGMNVTDWGALSAYSVPWIVIPYSFISKPYTRHELTGNNLAAVICDGQMFYGILGDSNGDSPEVIGEASWLLARTCFPDANLNGGIGHGKADVTYIVFNGPDAVVPDVGWSHIDDFGTLKSMGDDHISRLATNIGLLED